MNKFLIGVIILFSMSGNLAHAQKAVKSREAVAASHRVTAERTAVQKAGAWLRRAIEDNLNKANGLAENTNAEAEGQYINIYSKKYIAYKNDAIAVDMDGGMSLAAFRKKWNHDFDCRYAGVGVGYLVSGTDYGHIKVTRCAFLKKAGQAYWFDIIIRDAGFKINYKRNIRVIPSGKSFLIADVLEYNQAP